MNPSNPKSHKLQMLYCCESAGYNIFKSFNNDSFNLLIKTRHENTKHYVGRLNHIIYYVGNKI